MDFSFTEEQTLLRNMVERFVQNEYDLEQRRKIIASETGRKDGHWQTLAELGLLAAPFEEKYGGLGGSAIETMIVMEEFGKGLVIEPYSSTIIQCGGLIRYGASDAQKQELIPSVIDGSLGLAFAFAEPQSRFNLADVATKAEAKNGDYVLNGQKSVVIGGPWADKFIVTARTGGGEREEGGITCFLVDKTAEGVSTRDYPTIDGFRASELMLQNVNVSSESIIGEVGGAFPLIDRIADEAIAGLCAEAIGAMKVLNDTTVEFCKTRKQFGVPIGKFQVLQHRMVDMFMAYEQSVSMTYMVHLKLEEDDAERRKAASGAKVQIGKAGREIGQNAVQLHGGMGVTDELNVGHYFKRLTMIDTAYGNVDYHLKRYSAQG